MIHICKQLGISYYGKCKFRHYLFLYSTQRCVYIELKDARILILNKLLCKSKFEKALLPLDKQIQRLSLDEVVGSKAGIRTRLLFVIIDALLNSDGFLMEEKEFLKINRVLLKDLTFQKMLKNVFFKYTDTLLNLLLEEKYVDAYAEYCRYKDY